MKFLKIITDDNIFFFSLNQILINFDLDWEKIYIVSLGYDETWTFMREGLSVNRLEELVSEFEEWCAGQYVGNEHRENIFVIDLTKESNEDENDSAS